MSIFAHIVNGVVAELFTPPAGIPISSCFNPSLVWVDVTAVSPAPQPNWTAVETAGVWAFSAPAASALTLNQQANIALTAGLAITSTSTPALNGTYDVSGPSQDHIQAEMIALLASGGATFADGTTSVVWPDMSGALHTFNPAQGRAFFMAVGTYVALLYKCINGTLTTLPAPSATIT